MPDLIPAGVGAPPVTAPTAAQVAAVATSQMGFIQTTSVTVANSATETTLIGAGIGSATLPAAAVGSVGKTIALIASGSIATTLTPTLQIRWKLGGVTILDTTAATLAAITGTNQWNMFATATVRTTGATGNVFVQGYVQYGAGIATLNAILPVNTAVSGAINLSGTAATDLTLQWGTASASNTLTLTNLFYLLIG